MGKYYLDNICRLLTFVISKTWKKADTCFTAGLQAEGLGMEI